ncbi:hypothetical protein [Parabacteroides johnsonii]|uniref:hypothetical protein n=1 Tax=Parabacteroides johnsonii TaxID=387661 RepID=UPI003AB5DEEB
MERVFNYINVMKNIYYECLYGQTIDIENIENDKEGVKVNISAIFNLIERCRFDGQISDYYFDIIESLLWKQKTIEEKKLIFNSLLNRCNYDNSEYTEIINKIESIISHIGIGNELWAEYAMLEGYIREFNDFVSRINDLNFKDKNEGDVLTNIYCLHWTGQNNVLADMFRQAKNKGYITNSLSEIAQFLKNGFDCYANTKLSTIEGTLKNNNSSANAVPKEEKRIQVE